MTGVIFCITATGCKSSLPIVGSDRDANIVVLGGASMNGGGNAAVVRIYQLSSDTKFQHTSIESFWQNDVDALGSELIGASQELVIYPEQTKTLELKLDKEAQFIGVAADLRSPDPDRWRAVYPVREVRGKQIVVTVGEDRLQASM
ncbi:MAG TPA: type VI secretion system lipoprotein TssJ [Rhodothermales bacterium]|nr:type VI secretion system lipoprotein TssJ [Rhodothermales bacterium]